MRRVSVTPLPVLMVKRKDSLNVGINTNAVFTFPDNVVPQIVHDHV